MATIVTRAGKGSPLTNAELDANFVNLNTQLEGTLAAALNLSDLADAAAARANLGLGNVENKSAATILGELSSTNVTTALGFTPYNATNPSGYVNQAGARSAISVGGSLSYNSTTGVITYTQPTNVSTFTNDSGYITSSALAPYLTSADAASTYQTQAGMSSYLTTSAASATYLTQANAASTYQTQSGMSAYLTTSAASSTYLSQANAASTYQTLAGMSSYLTTSGASSTFFPLAGGTLTGNLGFNGTGLTIRGDMSNATASSRLSFQSSTTNGITVVSAKPNGTGTASYMQVFNAADVDNASYAYMGVTGTAVNITSNKTGTGSYLPMVFLTGGFERFRVNETTGNVLIGTTTDNAVDRLQVNGTIRSLTGGYVFPDGTALASINPRVVSIADAATITPTGSTADQYEVTALAQAATIAAPSGTPAAGQKLILRIKDNGTARALTWTTTSGAYRAVGVTLPTTTVLGKVMYVGCVWNSQDTFWDVVAVAQLA